MRRNDAVIAGCSRAARASANAMMCVNEIFSLRPACLSALFSSARRCSIVPTCSVRNDVATGIVSDCSMYDASVATEPLSSVVFASAGTGG